MIKLCVGIFLARVFDVTLGTIRTFMTVKGKTMLATIIAFFEIFIWFMVARSALNTVITSLWIPISYSLGYATGTLVGSLVSNNLINGIISVQVITKKDNNKLVTSIRNEGYGISIVNLKNDYDEVKKEMLLISLNKKSLKNLIKIIKKYDSASFMIINESKVVQNGIIK